MRCAETLRVQAYFDEEVDAVSAADVERHIEHCAECRALLEDLQQVRAVLCRESAFIRIPAPLRAQVMLALDALDAPALGAPALDIVAPDMHTSDRDSAAELAVPGGTTRTVQGSSMRARGSSKNSRSSPNWRLTPLWVGALRGVGGTALAAACAFFLLLPRLTSPLIDEVVSAHVRSLMPTHLIDVVSTDKHTVKPWFAGHTDVSPVVADFEPQGYRLVGGRADYLAHQRAAVVVYQHGAHVINVFSWADNERGLPNDVTRSGYHLAFWTAGDLAYCAVSDTSWDALLGLERLLRE